MRNIQYLTIDINKKTQQDVTANEGEIGSRFLKIKITDSNVPIDLTGTKVYLYALKSDNTKLFNLVEIVEATQGVVLAELTSQLLTSAGVVKLTLVLTEETKKLISKEFTLMVDNSIFDDDAIVSSNEFTALTTALGQVQNIDNRFNEVNEQFISIKSEKLDKNGILSMVNMGQDVKEAMTGGSVAVVGKNTVLTENIVDKQITRGKTNFYSIDETGNLIDRNAIIRGMCINNIGSTLNSDNETDFIPIDISKTYRFNFVSFVTFWGIDKNFISGYIQGSASTSVPVNMSNVPNAKYVRFSVYDSDLETCVFSQLEYFSNDLKTKFIDNDIVINKEQISNFSIEDKDFTNALSRNVLNYYSISNQGNLFINSKAIQGGYYSNTGVWINSSNHISSNLIEIDVNKKYKHNIFSFISFWDENEVFISGYIEGSGGATNPQQLRNVPSNAKYVRFSIETQAIESVVISLEEVFDLDLGYKFTDKELLIEEGNLNGNLLKKINSSSTTMAGKTVNFIGDSITYGYDGATQGRVTKPYPTLVGEILGCYINNYGISGSTIGGDGKTSTEHNILGNTPMNIRYLDMANADYVLVLGGVNDYTVDRRIPLGVKGDVTNLTFYGSLKILIEGLIEKYPNSRIGFITPLRKMNDRNLNVYGNHLKEYRNAIIEMCEDYSVPVLDLFMQGGCYANMSNWRTDNLPDGLHPNQLFYEKMAIQISSFIENM